MKGFQLIATGGALPGRTVTNEELSRTVDTSDEWITTRTGIRARHWCTEEESAATLAIAAAKQALERSGLSPQDIACCVCATLSAPDATPSVACQVQRALNLPENRPALDVNAACSGFIYGTAVARGLMATLGGRYALVVGCEALSRLMDQTDRSTCVLFGDGAGAAIFGTVRRTVCDHAGRTGRRGYPRRRPLPHRLGPHQHGRACRLPLCGGRTAPLSARGAGRDAAGAGRCGLGGLPSGQQPHHRPLCESAPRRRRKVLQEHGPPRQHQRGQHSGGPQRDGRSRSAQGRAEGILHRLRRRIDLGGMLVTYKASPFGRGVTEGDGEGKAGKDKTAAQR